MAKKALSDVKVIELGEFIMGPFCGKNLADMGAEVIKIEKPLIGDKSRRHGPFPDDEPNPEKSGLFLVLNCNKKSVTLDVNQPTGRKIFKQLLKDADILIDSNLPKMMKELGLDYTSLKKDFPKLIMVSITPYGQTGPYKDFKGDAITIGAMSGVHNLYGSRSREPLCHPFSYDEYIGGLAGALAASIALFDRDNTGKGRHCDIAVFQFQTGAFAMGNIEPYKILNISGMRAGNHNNTFFYPTQVLPCKDGYFTMFSYQFDHWQRFLEILGNPEWSKDERFNPPKCNSVFELAQYIDELDALLCNELERFTKAELFEACSKARIPFLPVMNIEDMMNNPQLKHRNEIAEVEHPVAGKLKYPGAPAILTETPITIESPAPLLGQHNQEIYCKRLGFKKEELVELRKAGIV
jgi:crotonobetainyl-CoA:carnitine CoA-transferase CaiB-like acyl-CoA transferase